MGSVSSRTSWCWTSVVHVVSMAFVAACILVLLLFDMIGVMERFILSNEWQSLGE
jgi:hypothetical protein